MTGKIKKLLFSKQTRIFLLFLLFSVFLWFTRALDQERITTIEIPIRYVGLPPNVKFIDSVATKVKIKIKDKGATLLQYQRDQLRPLIFQMPKTYNEEGQVLINQQNLKNRIYESVRPATSILSIAPDSILLKYTKLRTKRLPIRLNANIALKSQYTYSQPIKIVPKTIKVYGSKSALASLKAISTEEIKLEKVKDTTHLKVKLVNTKPQEIKYEKKSIEVTLFVQKFTEKKVNVPITIINSSRSERIKLFPSTLQVSYNVGLSYFNKVKATDLQLIFDVRKAKKSESRFYQPQIVVNTPYISNVNISPSRIEFLIIE